jgi:predicted RNA methylase
VKDSLPSNFSDPGFTPGARHFAALAAIVSERDETRAEAAERALARAGLPAARLALEQLSTAVAPARARWVRLVGRVARETHDAELRSRLLALLDDADDKSRRNAVIALGKIGGEGVEAGLLARLNVAPLPEQRSLVEALGKVGGPAALERLEALTSDDPELARLRDRAVVMLSRTHARSDAATELDLARGFDTPLRVVLRCRPGLAEVLQAEARSSGFTSARVTAPDRVELDLAGPLASVASLRTALDFALAVPLAGGDDGAIVRALEAPETLEALARLTRGPLRFRLAWAEGGHRRARVWRIAGELSRRHSTLINDPSDAPWEALVERDRLLWFPRGAVDRRFEYRRRDVPAASHPSIAAALARIAGVEPDDVVWDPFVGSGLELIERARLGPYRDLYGSDVDPRALDAARENLDAARVLRAHLVQADATQFAPKDVSLIITNPPMGRRVARDGTISDLIRRFVDAAARALAPAGRMVWLSPFPEKSARAFEAKRLDVHRMGAVDLGGFEAELQLVRKVTVLRSRHAG